MNGDETALIPALRCAPLLHIGYHKAASTWLQRECFPRIAPAFCQLPHEEVHALFRRGRFGRDFLRSLPEACDTQTLVLSNESLSGHDSDISRLDPFEIAERLHDQFPEGSVLIIVRNQLDYILSLYCYRVTVSGVEWRPFDAWLRSMVRRGLLCKLRYDELVGHYTGLFPPDRVTVLPMELLKLDPARFARKIADLVGWTGELPPTSQVVNRSYRDSNTLSVNRFLNLAFRGARALASPMLDDASSLRLRDFYLLLKRRFVNPRVLHAFHGGAVFCRDLRKGRDLERVFRASNRRLEALAGLDLAALGYPT